MHGWNDPRMPTIKVSASIIRTYICSRRWLIFTITDYFTICIASPQGLRRRGYTPAILNAFCRDIGVTRNENVVEYERLAAMYVFFLFLLYSDWYVSFNFISLPVIYQCSSIASWNGSKSDGCASSSSSDYFRPRGCASSAGINGSWFPFWCIAWFTHRNNWANYFHRCIWL